MAPVKKRDTLNTREKKFIKALAAGSQMTQAMRLAGYTENTANVCAGKKLREPLIAKTIQELMEARGLTKDKLLSKLSEGLEATKTISVDGTVSVPDYATQHKFLDTGFKLGRHYPNEKVEHGDIAIIITRKLIKIARGD